VGEQTLLNYRMEREMGRIPAHPSQINLKLKHFEDPCIKRQSETLSKCGLFDNKTRRRGIE